MNEAWPKNRYHKGDLYNFYAMMLLWDGVVPGNLRISPPDAAVNFHIRPYPLENSGSRPLSHRQASEGQTSSWVGDDQRIPGVVCLLPLFAEIELITQDPVFWV